MSFLEDKSREISNSLEEWRNDLLESQRRVLKEIEVTNEELRAAVADGDLRENSAYTNAVEKLSQLNAQMLNISVQSKEIAAIPEDEVYKHIGLIVLFSTMRLRVRSEEFVFKLYPGTVSAVEKGILAQNSPVGRAVWMKKAGDIVRLEDKDSGEPIEYEILEVY